MIKKLVSLLILLLPLVAAATHNRAGEITYRLISNLTYEITVTTYTKTSGISINADRCFLGINFGDNTSDSIPRTNGFLGTCGPIARMGDDIVGRDVKKNTYTTTHTYPGPGSFTISVEDPNRNAGILNILSSDQVRFYVQTELVISAFIGGNSSPVLFNDPIDEGCRGVPYYHNPGAVDAEGDSLAYSLVACRGANGVVIFNYQFPDDVIPNPNTFINIDPITGTVTWDSPNQVGEYNLCIMIKEFRNGQEIGAVVRDMQITINDCDNDPPFIDPLGPFCVTAGDTISEIVRATDPEGFTITLTATGEPFTVTNSPAQFTQPIDSLGEILQPFVWETTCDHVRRKPYIIVFRVEDFHPTISLSFYQTMQIQVVAPAPKNPVATPTGNTISLNWDVSECPQATGYDIYRRNGLANFTPSNCELGVPASTGYVRIGSVSGLNTTNFVDNNNNLGLTHGVQYCYIVVATFADGTESYASVEFCSELKKDLPVLTRVSVNSTSTSTGSDTIQWTPPTELDDSVQWPGPYQYKIFRGDGFGNPFPTTLVGQTGLFNDIALGDTIFVDNNLNTEDQAYSYRVALFSNGDSVGSSQVGSSPYLSVQSGDQELLLSWEEVVPWSNTEYVVYSYDQVNNAIIATLDTVDTNFYLDTGLVNGTEYCYLIQTIGEYSGTGFLAPLLSFSQFTCGIPEDLIPPCPPLQPLIQTDCTLDENRLNWVSPAGVCEESDDVSGYNIYFAPVLGQPLQFLTNVPDPNQTEILFPNLTSLAGCYGITALDSVGNESSFGEVLCTDNCPTYELPNVFTPGTDQFNDLFVPFPYKFVESIDLVVYNRWGREVFRTKDPDINWDGTDMESGGQLESGVYFYTCEVNEIRLTGIETRILKGYVQLINEGDNAAGN
ncbi:MAG: gliding motility-associated C-terminal domain-containing protein [Salibacteraceae bacterium]